LALTFASQENTISRRIHHPLNPFKKVKNRQHRGCWAERRIFTLISEFNGTRGSIKVHQVNFERAPGPRLSSERHSRIFLSRHADHRHEAGRDGLCLVGSNRKSVLMSRNEVMTRQMITAKHPPCSGMHIMYIFIAHTE
jgi:hypothetical protein